MKKKLVGIFVCMLLITTVLSVSGTVIVERTPISTSFGGILYVGGSGPGNYSTIQDAIDDASEGDTVFVYDDSAPYYENVVISKSINLVGENRDTTIIDGGKRGDVITVNSDDTTIKRFTFRREGWYDDGIRLNANNSFVAGNIFENNGAGIYSHQTKGHIIQNNTFYNNHDGIKIIDSEYFHVKNNNFDDNYFSGVALYDSYHNTVSNNIITANTDIAIQASYNGIRVVESKNNVFSNNHIISILDSCYAGINLWHSDNNTVLDNTFEKNGLARFDSYHNTVEGNTVNGKPLVFLDGETVKVIENAGQVILLNCANITVKQLLLSHTQVGIEVENSNNCNITKNIISKCWQGVYLDSSRNIIIRDNNIVDTRYGINIKRSPANYIYGNTLEDNIYGGLIISSNFNTIENNIIRNNPDGLKITSGFKNTVITNEITNNYQGIYLIRAFSNSFNGNNIYKNELEDAYFVNSFLNRWSRNYWKDLIPPHRIKGEVYIERGWHWGSPPPIIIPMSKFDLRPALKPYDI